MGSKNTIPQDVWKEQALLYGFGFKHAKDIAMELGVSTQTVTREMKRWGMKKGCLSKYTVGKLEAALDRKARQRAIEDLSDSKRKRRAAEANLRAAGHLVSALVEADAKGELSLAYPILDQFEDAFGIRSRKRNRGQKE